MFSGLEFRGWSSVFTAIRFTIAVGDSGQASKRRYSIAPTVRSGEVKNCGLGPGVRFQLAALYGRKLEAYATWLIVS
ncbi:MAG: hypothetical protein CMJ78_23800 [Planctomycetaceae bacterium]|nr:hypothetical protein [Planctomycetaceae bacterium]